MSVSPGEGGDRKNATCMDATGLNPILEEEHRPFGREEWGREDRGDAIAHRRVLNCDNCPIGQIDGGRVQGGEQKTARRVLGAWKSQIGVELERCTEGGA